MKRCVICDSGHDKKGKTCSWKCAGVLAHETRKWNLLRIHQKKRDLYSSTGKEKDYATIMKCLKYETDNSWIKNPMSKSVLTLEGSSIFTRKAIAWQRGYGSERNYITRFDSVDKDPALVKSANLTWSLGNSYPKPDYLSIENKTLLQKMSENHRYNFVWFDYCGNLNKGVVEDILKLQNVMMSEYFFFITLYRARENMGVLNDIIISDYDGYITYKIGGILNADLFYKNTYKHMVTYGFCSKNIFGKVKKYMKASTRRERSETVGIKFKT